MAEAKDDAGAIERMNETLKRLHTSGHISHTKNIKKVSADVIGDGHKRTKEPKRRGKK